MHHAIRFSTLMFFALIIGCSSYSSPAINADPVDVSGKLTLRGKPLTNVVLTFQPTEAGLPAELTVAADGSFSGKVTPGRYTYFIAGKGGNEASIKHVPVGLRSGNMDRQITVSGGELALKLD